MKLALCRQCRRHVKAAEDACPFCGNALLDHAPAARTLALAVGIGLTVVSCSGESLYAGPPVANPPPDAAPDAVDDAVDDADSGPVAMYGPVPVDAAPGLDGAYGPPPP